MDEKQTELNYNERLLIRQALERLYTPDHLQPLLTAPSAEDMKEAERLQWWIKDASKVVLYGDL